MSHTALDQTCELLEGRFDALGADAAIRLRRWLSGEIPNAYPEMLEKHLSEEHVDCSIVTLHGGHIWGNVCFIRRGKLVYHYGILGHGVEEKGGLDALLGPKISLLDQYQPEL